MKLEIRTRKFAFYGSGLDGYTLRQSVEILEQLAQKYGDGAMLDYDYDYGESSGEYEVIVVREETDEEYAERTNKTAYLENLKEQEERQKLRELLAKYPEEHK